VPVETVIKYAQRPPARRGKLYAFASGTKPGLWRVRLVRGLLPREDVEALAAAAGLDVTWIGGKEQASP
jgi:nitroreductase